MKKKVVAIDLDEVIRSKWIQFDRFYAQEFGEDGIKQPFDTYDLRNHFDFKDKTEVVNYLNEEIPDDISPTEYMLDDNGNAPVDHLAFRKREESMTAEQAFNKFLYEDFLVEIFGSAPVLYRGLDLDLKRFVQTYQNTLDIMLFSTEKNESISPSLFFISKLRPTIRKFVFTQTPEEIWSHADIVITSDPKIINSKPAEQDVVVVSRQYNLNISDDLTVLNVVDLIESAAFQSLITKIKI